MGQKITIEPVSRIEGHAKITVQLDTEGEVQETRFHVNEFRGFEKFCEGRLLWEMPGITSRICGICPSSHLITSAKAGDSIFAVSIPETAEKLRRMLTLAQWTQSHALRSEALDQLLSRRASSSSIPCRLSAPGSS